MSEKYPLENKSLATVGEVPEETTVNRNIILHKVANTLSKLGISKNTSVEDSSRVKSRKRREVMTSARDAALSAVLPIPKISLNSPETAQDLIEKLNREVFPNPAGNSRFAGVISAQSALKETLESTQVLKQLQSDNPAFILKAILGLTDDLAYNKLIINASEGDTFNSEYQWLTFKPGFIKLSEMNTELIHTETNWKAFDDFSGISHEEIRALIPYAPDEYLQKIVDLEQTTLDDLNVLTGTYSNVILSENMWNRGGEGITTYGNNGITINNTLLWNITNCFTHETNNKIFLEFFESRQSGDFDTFFKMHIEYDGEIAERAGKLIREVIKSPFFRPEVYAERLYSILEKLEKKGISTNVVIDILKQKGIDLPDGIGEVINTSGVEKHKFYEENMLHFIASYSQFNKKSD